MSTVEWNEQEVTLLELLDRALDKGVVVWGEVTLSVADVDLVYLGLKLLLCSVETAGRMHPAAGNQGATETSGPDQDLSLR